MGFALDKTRDILAEELDNLRRRIIANMVARRAVVSGKTRDSLRIEATAAIGRLYDRNAFGTLETGRKPGKVPQGFRFIIQQWAIDAGLRFDSRRELESFAYLVARKIAKEGTKLYRDGGRSDIYSQEIPNCIEAIQRRVAKVVAGGITINEQIKLTL